MSTYNLERTINRLKIAIRQKSGIKLLITKKEWFSEQKQVLMPYYIISQHHYDPKTKKTTQEELFKAGNKVKVLLFLRDYWYTLNNWEIPRGEFWDEKEERYKVRYDGAGKNKIARSTENTANTD